MISFAEKDMIPALKALWSEAFEDPAPYIDLYFVRRFRAEETMVWLEHDTPVAMLTLLPCQVRQKGMYRPARYVYAVATRKEYRGQGLAARLLARVVAEPQGAVPPQGETPILTLLAPAERGLFAYYAKQGAHSAFPLKTVELCAQELSAADASGFRLSPASPRLYQKLRDRRFEREGYVRWDEAAIAYALRENEFLGGVACRIESRFGEAVALCLKQGEQVLLRETTLPDEALPGAAAVIAHRMKCTGARIRLPEESALGGEAKPFGMVFPGGCTHGYLNLALD